MTFIFINYVSYFSFFHDIISRSLMQTPKTDCHSKDALLHFYLDQYNNQHTKHMAFVTLRCTAFMIIAQQNDIKLNITRTCSSGRSSSSAAHCESALETDEGDPAHTASRSVWCRTNCSPEVKTNKQTNNFNTHFTGALSSFQFTPFPPN